MDTIYYDHDADLYHLEGKAVGVIGYGIQGRAQALNLRDAGVRVLVANRKDRYADQAAQDGFEAQPIAAVVRAADIVLFLIPDQAQADVYEASVKGALRPGAMLVFAHGYALRYRTVALREDCDVAMLAPRMPGHHIRSAFQRGGGVPAFVDVAQDATGRAWPTLLALAKAAGFTRAGVLKVSFAVEAELDLFIEQFLVASIVRHVYLGFKVLVEELGYPAVPTLMELYASGELAEVLKLAARMGIGEVFQRNASPTCQFGIAANFNGSDGHDPAERIKRIVAGIRDGSFAKRLDAEGRAGYPMVRRLWEMVDDPRLLEAQAWIARAFRGEEAP